MTTPVLTVKNLKVAQFASEETLCFEAAVYVDGRPFCRARNDGQGGPNQYHAVKGADNRVYAEIEALGKRLAPNSVATRQEADALNAAAGMTYDALGWDAWEAASKAGQIVKTHYEVFDNAVDAAIVRAQIAKDLRRSMKDRVLFTKPGQPGVFQTGRLSAAHMNALLTDRDIFIRLKAAEILNLLPFERALDIYHRAT